MGVSKVKLNKFSNVQLDLLKKLGVVIDSEKEYSNDDDNDEIQDILDILIMRINRDDGNISDEGNICEDIITIITTDDDW
jgi:hypothetical protein